MHQITPEHGKQRADQEGRVGRPAKQRHAGDELIHRAKCRGVPAEPVKRGDERRDAEEADIARPGEAAHEPETDQHDKRHRADVELSHVLGEEQIGRSPGEARRAPIVHLRVGGAEQVGERQREQVRGMERSASGGDEVERRTVGVDGKEPRHRDRHGDDERTRERAGSERPQARGDARERMLADPVRDHHADQ